MLANPCCLNRIACRERGFCAFGNRFALVPIETDSGIPTQYNFLRMGSVGRKDRYQYVAEKMSSLPATDGVVYVVGKSRVADKVQNKVVKVLIPMCCTHSHNFVFIKSTYHVASSRWGLLSWRFGAARRTSFARLLGSGQILARYRRAEC
jgi:hypothetical protein